jgi:hypothetical protein
MFKKYEERAGIVAQVVEHLPRKPLVQIPVPPKLGRKS